MTEVGKKLASVLLMAVLIGTVSVSVQQASATIGFQGDYDPSNWTLTNTNADGFVNDSGAPGSIILVGGDNNSFAAGNTDYTIIIPCGGTISFSWNYRTADRDGPAFDPAAFLVNGVAVQITNNSGPRAQSGTNTVTVATGDVFGFRIHTTDNIFGRGAFTSINSLVTPDCNAPPDCSGASPSVASIWPPNHKLVDIEIDGVTDPDGDSVTITVTGITQDEPTNGLGDGDTSPDAAGVGSQDAQVRAERSGDGDGRVYDISFSASDGNGGVCRGLVAVGVPHDVKDVAVDSGQTYNSTS